jgi:hypothetical protein
MTLPDRPRTKHAERNQYLEVYRYYGEEQTAKARCGSVPLDALEEDSGHRKIFT